jgi:hypothetical protein
VAVLADEFHQLDRLRADIDADEALAVGVVRDGGGGDGARERMTER